MQPNHESNPRGVSVGYFAADHDASPEVVSFITAWSAVMGTYILKDDISELAVAFAAHVEAFSIVDSLDLEDIEVTGAMEPEWR